MRLRLVLALAAAAATAGALIYLGTWPPVATVMSGSMAPTINTGDVVVLQRLRRAPKVGDVVAVAVPDDARTRYGYPPEVIHRVVAMLPGGRIQTKGDARKLPDPFTVSRRTVTARVAFTIPAAGRVTAFLTSTMGILWLAAGALLLVGLPFAERRREDRERDQRSIDALHAELRSISAELAELRAEAQRAPVRELPRPPAPDPPRAPTATVRRSGGVVGSVQRRARSLATRYR